MNRTRLCQMMLLVMVLIHLYSLQISHHVIVMEMYLMIVVSVVEAVLQMENVIVMEILSMNVVNVAEIILLVLMNVEKLMVRV